MAHRPGHCPETRVELGPRKTRLRQQDPSYATHLPAIFNIIVSPGRSRAADRNDKLCDTAQALSGMVFAPAICYRRYVSAPPRGQNLARTLTMALLITGSAGFIGYHLSARMLEAGEPVIGIDNLNDYYDVALKRARLAQLERHNGFTFHRLDVADYDGIMALVERHPEIDRVVHLAAQAGVRYSLSDPLVYVESNVRGQVVLLEAARRLKKLKKLIYASSSSVYGGNTKQPYSVEDRADCPVSLYAATKRAGELITESYCRSYGLAAIGFRFFTVYGPWGRPDMALYTFTNAILAGRPINVFNNGQMSRDFTYIDDTITAVATAAEMPPGEPGEHRLYNVGNNRPETLFDFIATLEKALGRTATKKMLPMQAGDVVSTYADIEATRRDFGFDPKTPINEGIPRFVEWYRAYHGVA
jgi:UDP-glucuronate 4-epimerase